MYYAQIDLTTRICFAVTETHSPINVPHMIERSSLDTSVMGKRHNEATGEFDDVAPAPVAQHMTKRSFQNRFPKLANGISTKYDAMIMFLTDDGYAASLGVTGAALYELRMLITTGKLRMDASPFVDMTPGAEADTFTALLMQSFIPTVFKLSAGERTTLMTTPLIETERYKG